MTKIIGLQNIYENLSTSSPKELVETLDSSSAVTIERIVSCGQSTPAGEWIEQERTRGHRGQVFTFSQHKPTILMQKNPLQVF